MKKLFAHRTVNRTRPGFTHAGDVLLTYCFDPAGVRGLSPLNGREFRPLLAALSAPGAMVGRNLAVLGHVHGPKGAVAVPAVFLPKARRVGAVHRGRTVWLDCESLDVIQGTVIERLCPGIRVVGNGGSVCIPEFLRGERELEFI